MQQSWSEKSGISIKSKFFVAYLQGQRHWKPGDRMAKVSI
jgi:hypothetical protein